MTTFDQLIDPLLTQRAALERQGQALADEATHLLDRCAAHDRTPNSKEQERQRAIKSEAYALRDRIVPLNAKIAMLQGEQAEDIEQARQATIFTPSAPAPQHREFAMTGTSTREREDYTLERDRRGERSYFSDLFRAEQGDVGARSRIQQFTAENRATSTASFAGLVVPQYLTDQAALLARSGRPFADSVTSLQIPEQGSQFQIPKGTTGASAAVQATENTSVSATDEVWSNITLNVATVAGQQDVSRQSIERGTPGIDQLVMSDLAGAYGVALDQQCLSGSGSAGQVLGALLTAGVNQATAFVAAATATTFWLKCAGQIAAVATARGIAPTHIAMHPRRFAWLVGQVDTQGRPLVLPSTHGPANVMGTTDGPPAYGIAAGQSFQGLQIVVDASIPTAVGSGPEDQVLVYRADDLLLYEHAGGAPSELRFEQTLANQLTIKIVCWGYLAFTAARYPTAVGIVGGNSGAGLGLVSPAF